MAIIKVKKRTNFYVQIDKKSIEDKNLSFKATGLLVYLIGRPDDWKIILDQLKTCKTDGKDSVRTALLELRRYNYCHLFEVREKGIIKDKFYYIFEVPTPYSDTLLKEIMKEFKDYPEGTGVIYKPVKNKSRNNNYEKKSPEPKFENPETDKPDTVKPEMENPTLLIKKNTNNRSTNKKTTTKENKKSSSYSFLNKEKYPELHDSTIRNIRKNVSDLSEERFKTVYLLTQEYILSGKGENFNAILYKALKKEWNFNTNTPPYKKKELSEEKKKWLSRYTGITSNKALRKEIEEIICEIPIEELHKNRDTLSALDTFQFKMFLVSLRSKYRSMSKRRLEY